MSSRAFVAELKPEPLLRRVLALSAMLGYLLGVVVICSVPVDTALARLGIAIWTLHSSIQWLFISSAHKRFVAIRIHCDGTAELLDRNGNWGAAVICRECLVLSNLAWLKLKPAVGGTYCEFLRGNARGKSPENQQWRRLQVIWRHLGPVPGSC